MSVRFWGLAFTTALILQLTGCATQDKKSLNPLQGATLEKSQKPDADWQTNQHLERIIAEALSLQGRPYVPGGESPRTGFDCSGFVYYVFNRQGIKLPRDAASMAHELPNIQHHQRKPGDLVFFSINRKRPFSHVGIYLGDDRFIHAASSRTGQVTISDMRLPYWQERFTGVRRLKSTG
jgi:cell wall-associated NlpC family hydrolase